jgi:hypothetical protein
VPARQANGDTLSHDHDFADHEDPIVREPVFEPKHPRNAQKSLPTTNPERVTGSKLRTSKLTDNVSLPTDQLS